jgi:hypothetical protein
MTLPGIGVGQRKRDIYTHEGSDEGRLIVYALGMLIMESGAIQTYDFIVFGFYCTCRTSDRRREYG